jgi:hypothetical protein
LAASSDPNGSGGYDVGSGQVRLEGKKLSDRVRVVWRSVVEVVGVVGKNGQRHGNAQPPLHAQGEQPAEPRNILAQSAVTRRRVVSSEWPSSDARVKESGSTGHISPALCLGTRWSASLGCEPSGGPPILSA